MSNHRRIPSDRKPANPANPCTWVALVRWVRNLTREL